MRVELVKVGEGPVFVRTMLRFLVGDEVVHEVPVALQVDEYVALRKQFDATDAAVAEVAGAVSVKVENELHALISAVVPALSAVVPVIADWLRQLPEVVGRDVRTQLGASLPSDPTATSSLEGAGRAKVDEFRGPSPLRVPGCTCPWNNGWLMPAVLTHHVGCPSLKKLHHPYDGCGAGGHRDDLVVNVTWADDLWVEVSVDGVVHLQRQVDDSTWEALRYTTTGEGGPIRG